MNTAIIVAAGSGSRFSSETPKQFIELLGKPVVIRTLERFESCDEITSIVLVLPPSQIDAFHNLAAGYEFAKMTAVVAGGDSRAQSVVKGLERVDPQTKIVAVHDGARPLVTIEDITRVIHRADETGAACLVAHVTDTIKEIDGDRIEGTLERRNLRRALTPQAFHLEILLDAYENADAAEVATDDSSLVEEQGYEVTAVPGSPRNIKITHPEDLIIAEALLRDEEGK